MPRVAGKYVRIQEGRNGALIKSGAGAEPSKSPDLARIEVSTEVFTNPTQVAF